MTIKRFISISLLLLIGGCAAQNMHRKGLELIEEGSIRDGIEKLGAAVSLDPEDVSFRKDFYSARYRALSQLNQRANGLVATRNYTDANSVWAQVLEIDPQNPQAKDGIAKVRRLTGYDEILSDARNAFTDGKSDTALDLIRSILIENSNFQPALDLKREVEESAFRGHFMEISLKDTYSKPISLEFRDANVRMVFEVLSRTSGINFILDKDIPADARTTVYLRNAYVDEAIDLILRNSQLRRKILSPTTVQVYPDTLEKQKDYQELVVRAFYLHDASVSQMQTVFKTLLKMKDIVVDERLNLITVRDTPDTIRLAEKLVALHDLSEPEVMLEVEVLEVNHDDLLNFGVQWPNQLSLTPLSQFGNALTLDDLKNLNSRRLGAAVGGATINMRQDHGISNLLANPKIRVHNREKASVLIGDKVPVITTTATSTGFVSESVQYLDVGLKLNVEPLIHPTNEISLKLNMEVSSIAKQIPTSNGGLAYQIGTRNASTFLRLKDGETQILAGLINDEERHSSSGVPGIEPHSFGRSSIFCST